MFELSGFKFTRKKMAEAPGVANEGYTAVPSNFFANSVLAL